MVESQAAIQSTSASSANIAPNNGNNDLIVRKSTMIVKNPKPIT